MGKMSKMALKRFTYNVTIIRNVPEDESEMPYDKEQLEGEILLAIIDNIHDIIVESVKQEQIEILLLLKLRR